MLIKCIANHGSKLAPIFYIPEERHNENTFYPLTINSYYIVYGMTLHGGYIWYYIQDDRNLNYPTMYPCGLFEVTNGQLSKCWIFSFYYEKGTNPVKKQTIIAYPDWANHAEHYYNDLHSGDSLKIQLFQKYKAFMDLEFPHLGVKDKAIAIDNQRLFCSHCQNRWQTESKTGMVICPNCERFMHNPNYLNPLPKIDF